jgi:phage internal scaffolding protein
MARYQSTGELPDLASVAPQYLDATGMDFQAMQNKLVEAQSLFDSLPSKIRNRFANDPGEFLAFVSDPSNHSELQSMGLLNEPSAAPNVSPSGGPTSDSASVDQKSA